jgi:hydroxyacylglutathione hydrolase
VQRKQQDGVLVLDTRTAVEFGAGHVPGAIHIGLAGQYASWAGTLLGLDHPVILVADQPDKLNEARLRLARVGIEKIAGYLGAGRGDTAAYGMLAWQRAGLTAAAVPQISVLDLHEQLRENPDSVQVIDVRRAAEWDTGHIAEARNKPLHKLRTLLADLDPQKPVAVHCKSGYRSSIASSLLLRAGFQHVVNVNGGFDAWSAQNLPVVREASTVPSCKS